MGFCLDLRISDLDKAVGRTAWQRIKTQAYPLHDTVNGVTYVVEDIREQLYLVKTCEAKWYRLGIINAMLEEGGNDHWITYLSEGLVEWRS